MASDTDGGGDSDTGPLREKLKAQKIIKEMGGRRSAVWSVNWAVSLSNR